MQILPSTLDPNLFATFSYIINTCRQDSIAWFPDTADDLFFMAACVAGEGGEVANAAKKAYRGTHTDDETKAKIEEETIDVLIYLANIWHILGTDVRKVYDAKRAANQIRFGSGRVGAAGPDSAGE